MHREGRNVASRRNGECIAMQKKGLFRAENYELRGRKLWISFFNVTFSIYFSSSSAALESCFAFALNDLFGDNKVSKWDLVLAGQATEHKYVGVNCGIMDQFASVFGKEGKLMRLDCNSREFEYFPFEPKGYKLCLVNSKVKHELAGSPYNDRRNSCENVVKHAESVFRAHPDIAILVLHNTVDKRTR